MATVSEQTHPSGIGHFSTDLASECLSFLTNDDLCLVTQLGNHQWLLCVQELVLHSPDPVSLAHRPRNLARLLALSTALMDWLTLREFLDRLLKHWVAEWPIWISEDGQPSDSGSRFTVVLSQWNPADGWFSDERSHKKGITKWVETEHQNPHQNPSVNLSLADYARMPKSKVSPQTRMGLIWLFVLHLCELLFKTVDVQIRFLLNYITEIPDPIPDSLPLRCVMAVLALLKVHPWTLQHHERFSSALFPFLCDWISVFDTLARLVLAQQQRGAHDFRQLIQKSEEIMYATSTGSQAWAQDEMGGIREHLHLHRRWAELQLRKLIPSLRSFCVAMEAVREEPLPRRLLGTQWSTFVNGYKRYHCGWKYVTERITDQLHATIQFDGVIAKTYEGLRQ